MRHCARAVQMEAEIYLRAQQLGEANQQLKRANEELARLYEQLQELDNLKTQFFSNVSHEFRTPLTLMLAPLEDLLAKPEGTLPPEDRAQLAMVQRNGLRLQTLVNTWLDFSRLEAGRAQAVYEPVDLAAFSAELASAFRAAIEQAGMRLIVDCPPLPEPVYVDRGMWETTVLNLLSNALKFTWEGQIEVVLRQVGEAAELAVRDTGTGIAPEEVPRLFERFHRVQGARGRTHEGTGIGLAMVRELVALHGGTVRVESVYGQGSTFTVLVPLGSAHLPADRIRATGPSTSTALSANPQVEEALRWLPDPGPTVLGAAEPPAHAQCETSPHRSAPHEEPSPVRRARIVLADDHVDMRNYVGRLLRERYEVETVADGEAALAAVHARRPDLVLTDVMMPGLDGFGLLRQLRSDPRTRAIPVIMLFARAGEDAHVEGLEAGADDYLIKPFSARELLARVGAQLEAAREAARREAALERRVLERTAQLRAAHQELAAFSCSISHDLRGPLRAIHGFARLLLDDYAPHLDAEAQHYLHRMCDNALRMGHLIDDLLAFARLSHEPLRTQPVLPAELVQQALEDVRQEGEPRRVELAIGDLPSCQADPALLKQVFVHLLGNALKFTRGREVAHIEVGCRDIDGARIYYVRDNGVGFDMQYAHQLFGVFQRLHHAEHFPGRGIGLALAQRIVQRHGGRIWAEGAVDQGATFSFMLEGGGLAVPGQDRRPLDTQARSAEA